MPSRTLLCAVAIAAMLPGGAMAQTSADATQTFGSGTWYGSRGLSAHTASGDRFDEEAMAAASNRFPLGSVVRVTMQDTGASVVVRINDRIGGRGTLIDLTKGAARQIGLLGRGRGDVAVAATGEAVTEVAEASEDEVADIGEHTPHYSRRAARPAFRRHSPRRRAMAFVSHAQSHHRRR